MAYHYIGAKGEPGKKAFGWETEIEMQAPNFSGLWGRVPLVQGMVCSHSRHEWAFET